jgi:hypothetical protein
VRDLIRRMSFENPLWGAPKIHGELLKLGIKVAQSTVSIYMVPRQDRPLQTWKTFLRNHNRGDPNRGLGQGQRGGISTRKQEGKRNSLI